MRSINTISSKNQEQEDYYTNDESLGDDLADDSTSNTKSSSKKMTQAVWHGRGASTLGLEGYVQRKDFRQVFYGYQAGIEERIRGERPNRNTKERLAHDLTLSAPKSFSMAMHLGGDVRLFDIHMEAVKETLDLVEVMYAQARLQVDGDRQVVNTGNLIATIIPHHTSREMDMQLHSHCVIMNGTQCPDGKWRSLWHESIVDAEWLGSYYRQLLAQKVQELGYEIYETQLEKGHSFEIKRYTQEQIAGFSKRSRQIVESLQRRGLEVNAESRDSAVLTTRKVKQIEETLAELQSRWRAEAGVMGIDNPLSNLRAIEPLGHGSAKEELESAIRHLSERSVSFSSEDIYQYVFNHIQTFSIEDLNTEIARHKKLVPLGKKFTTVDAIERETSTIKAWMLGQGKTRPIMSEAAAIQSLEGVGLNSGQATAVAKTVSAVDQHMVIYGLSGVGKTTAMRELKRLIEKSGVDVSIRGYSPTIKAAKILQESLGIETNTVESLVLKDAETVPNQLWIVDEAGMVSARQMKLMVNKANAVGARILLVGDTKQNPSIEAGSPMRSLMDNGATTFSLREIIRQKNEVQKRAVELIADGHAANALSLLVEHGYVQEVPETKYIAILNHL